MPWWTDTRTAALEALRLAGTVALVTSVAFHIIGAFG